MRKWTYRRWGLAAVVVLVLGLCAACSSGGSGSAEASSSHDASSSHHQDGITVPLKVESNGRATLEIVPVRINGHGPYKFLLDTGSAVSSISKSLAKRLGLHETSRTKKISGVASSTRIHLTRMSTWRLGRAHLAPETIGVVQLSKATHGIAGLIGSDELKRFGKVTIDFQHGRLTLAHRVRSLPGRERL